MQTARCNCSERLRRSVGAGRSAPACASGRQRAQPGAPSRGVAMDTTSARARLVEPLDFAAEFAAITATIPRSEIEAALSSDLPAELYLDVKRPSGETDAE